MHPNLTAEHLLHPGSPWPALQRSGAAAHAALARRHRHQPPGDQPRPPWPARATRRSVAAVGPRLWPLEVERAEAIPATGGVIIAANHLSFFDSVALALSAGRPLSFIGKAEYLDRWGTRTLFPALGMIPVDRSSGPRAAPALAAAAGVLAAGGAFAIYPEGTRSRDGRLHRGHTGVGHLALTTGAPIVPAGIVGTDRIQPPGARAPRPFRSVRIRFGTPLEPSSFSGTARQRRRAITEALMAAIAGLSGQEVAGD